uniref:Taste receptor type 2 n=1 Tax=Apteryx owenii TaxID=8824 RepID=A0A8B9Q0E5_APTOW
MPTLFSLIFLIIAIIESMAGLLGNGTILAVSSTSWVRSKILSFYDMIMIFLSLYRFCLQSWMMLDLFLSLFYAASYYVDNLFVTFKIVFMFLNYSSLWFAAWLSIFCCTKVATFTQSFFIWLKQRMSSFVPWMLITSSLFSFATSKMKTSLFLLILLCKAGVALPLTVFVVSGILLIRSLGSHGCHKVSLLLPHPVCYIFYCFVFHFIQHVLTFQYLGSHRCSCNGCLSSMPGTLPLLYCLDREITGEPPLRRRGNKRSASTLVCLVFAYLFLPGVQESPPPDPYIYKMCCLETVLNPWCSISQVITQA